MQYDNTNSGILTRNDKGDNERRPDYKGSINIDGQDYWLSAWIRTGSEGSKLAGQKYMSLKAELKEQQSAPARPKTVAKSKPQVADAFEDQEIPF
jgi:hypothetical protein